MTDQRILMILDLDETLLYSVEQRLGREPDCAVGPYHVYRRPHLEEFLTSCGRNFEMAVWTSSSADYAEAVVQATFPADIRLRFVWSRERCVQRLDAERHQTYFVKDLKKIKRLGYDLNRVLIVDDTPQKLERNYGNALYVTPFLGDANDGELRRLARYLETIREVANVRSLEKRGWRGVVQPDQ